MQKTATSNAPSSPTPTPMDRVRRIASLMRGMVLVGGTIFTVTTIAMWATPELIRGGVVQQMGIEPGSITITPAVQFYGALISLLPLALGIVGMVQVWFLFGEYAQGRIFTAIASKRLRLLAWSLIGAAAMQVAARTLHGLVLTMNNPPGKKMLVLCVSSNDFSFIIFGVLLLGIAWVMVEATRLAQENAEFI